MPKSRVVSKVRGVKGRAIRTPVKIGGRSSTKSALRMSTEELLNLFHSKATRGKDRNKIKVVLESRGADLTPPVEETVDE